MPFRGQEPHSEKQLVISFIHTEGLKLTLKFVHPGMLPTLRQRQQLEQQP